MLTDLGIYERRLDRIGSGLPPFSLAIRTEETVSTLVDASTLDELYSLLYSAVSRYPREGTIIVEDLVSGRRYRGPWETVLRNVRNRRTLDTLF